MALSDMLDIVGKSLPLGLGVPGGDGRFKGIPFFIESFRIGDGHDVIVHKFPDSDIIYTEDDGKKAPDYTVNCFFLIDGLTNIHLDFISKLTDGKAGVLELPNIKPDTVLATNYSGSMTKNAMNVFKFSVAFVKEGGLPKTSPASLADQLTGDIAGVVDSVDKYLQYGTKFKGYPSRVIKTIDATLDRIAGSVGALTSPTTFTGDVKALATSVHNLAKTDPKKALQFTAAPIYTASPNDVAVLSNNIVLETSTRAYALAELVGGGDFGAVSGALGAWVPFIQDHTLQSVVFNLCTKFLSTQAKQNAENIITLTHPTAAIVAAYAYKGDAGKCYDIIQKDDMISGVVSYV